MRFGINCARFDSDFWESYYTLIRKEVILVWEILKKKHQMLSRCRLLITHTKCKNSANGLNRCCTIKCRREELTKLFTYPCFNKSIDFWRVLNWLQIYMALTLHISYILCTEVVTIPFECWKLFSSQEMVDGWLWAKAIWRYGNTFFWCGFTQHE